MYFLHLVLTSHYVMEHGLLPLSIWDTIRPVLLRSKIILHSSVFVYIAFFLLLRTQGLCIRHL